MQWLGLQKERLKVSKNERLPYSDMIKRMTANE